MAEGEYENKRGATTQYKIKRQYSTFSRGRPSFFFVDCAWVLIGIAAGLVRIADKLHTLRHNVDIPISFPVNRERLDWEFAYNTKSNFIAEVIKNNPEIVRKALLPRDQVSEPYSLFEVELHDLLISNKIRKFTFSLISPTLCPTSSVDRRNPQAF